MKSATFLILSLSVVSYIIIDQVGSTPVEKVTKPISSKDKKSEEKPSKLSTTTSTTPIVKVEEEIINEPSVDVKATAEDVVVEGAHKETLQMQEELGPVEPGADELIYAEDVGYKEYNLTLQTPPHEENSAQLSASTLITALGLPTTSSFMQALLAAYTLPKGPALVEDILSQLLLIDDNLLVNLVQSLGKDVLKKQGLTMEEFQGFLLDDDNESMNLLRKLLIDASKGKTPIEIKTKQLPYIKELDKVLDFEAPEKSSSPAHDIEDAPIIYTPNLEKTPTTRPAHAESTPFSLNFNKIPHFMHHRRFNILSQDESKVLNPPSSSPSLPTPPHAPIPPPSQPPAAHQRPLFYPPQPNYQPQILPYPNPQPSFPIPASTNMPPGLPGAGNSPINFPGPQTGSAPPVFDPNQFQGHTGQLANPFMRRDH